ncbi:phosphotransferase family protein [Kitasatospora sp. NPDC057223]|uniref:phosphotransferase family protein n=1 Tax=Kitasatospora sp. NPDC057223 TaxID=3346055 RepID=UPI0036314E9E
MTVTTTSTVGDTLPVLQTACQHTDFPSQGAQLIRAMDNAMWRLPGTGVVARVHGPGTALVARNEVRGAYWLYANHIPVALPRHSEPIIVDGRPVTFWTDLGAGGPTTPGEIARILRDLHNLPVPTPDHLPLPTYNPFLLFPAQIEAAQTTHDAKDWLRAYTADLRENWLALDWPTATCVIHGDSGPGNTMVTPNGPHLIDLERLSIGHREWDQATAAWQTDTFGAPTDAYAAFRQVYRSDVTQWAHGYRMIRDVRSLSACLFSLRHADKSTAARAEADHRLACIQGLAGDRPWQWARPRPTS